MQDSDPFPFGKHKGTPIGDVPASYLLWLYDNGLKDGSVKTYIDNNMKHLQEEDVQNNS